jgi:phosphopantetheinyl transferase
MRFHRNDPYYATMTVAATEASFTLDFFERDGHRRPSPEARSELDRLVLEKASSAVGLDSAELRLSAVCAHHGPGDHGKPCVVGPTGARLDIFDFSISHCEGLTAVATSRDGWVGVDLERILDVEMGWEIACSAFTDLERRTLRHARDVAVTATRIWTRKEAVTKAIGTGVTTDFHKLQVGPEEGVEWPSVVAVGSLTAAVGNFMGDNDLVGAVAVVSHGHQARRVQALWMPRVPFADANSRTVRSSSYPASAGHRVS